MEITSRNKESFDTMTLQETTPQSGLLEHNDARETGLARANQRSGNLKRSIRPQRNWRLQGSHDRHRRAREFQYERGDHRVQRVPETETKGRIHTSAATVAVLPEPEDVEVDLQPDDYRRDNYRASGPGGKKVNKTDSAVRLTHHETGIVVAIQDEKSQHKNLAKAIRILKSRIYEHLQRAENEKRADERKSLAGSGDRSQRIRTYNFPDNRVTDHRIGLTIYKLDQIIAGNVSFLTKALIDHDRQTLRDSMEQ